MKKKTPKLTYCHIKINRKPITLEDFITMITTEFVKQHKGLLNKVYWEEKTDMWKTPYLKMSYETRRKISEKVTKTLWR